MTVYLNTPSRDLKFLYIRRVTYIQTRQMELRNRYFLIDRVIEIQTEWGYHKTSYSAVKTTIKQAGHDITGGLDPPHDKCAW